MAIIPRKELKYYINHIDYINLSAKLSNVFTKDKNSLSDGYYHVRSLYFDNKSNNSYYEKLSGIENRNKYRVRVYNLNTDPIKLEIKSKLNHVILKESVLIKEEDIGKLISGSYDFLLDFNNTTAARVFSRFTKDYYHPVILIDYKRDAYSLDIENIRITFDFEIKKDEVNLANLTDRNISMLPAINSSKVIMEIKYNNILPVWVKKMLQTDRFERCAISKYTLSRYMQN